MVAQSVIKSICSSGAMTGMIVGSVLTMPDASLSTIIYVTATPVIAMTIDKGLNKQKMLAFRRLSPHHCVHDEFRFELRQEDHRRPVWRRPCHLDNRLKYSPINKNYDLLRTAVTLIKGADFTKRTDLMSPEYVAKAVLKLLEDKINGSTLIVTLDGYNYIDVPEELKAFI
ncbi:hypothetical protein TNCV_869191, partial [Trichonephila clavipes]